MYKYNHKILMENNIMYVVSVLKEIILLFKTQKIVIYSHAVINNHVNN